MVGERAHLGRHADRDAELLALCAGGDHEALAELYDRHGRVAYGLALRVVRDRELAEDAVQEAFVAVWRAAGTFRPELARPRSWILTLVHRRAVDVVRREQRVRPEPPPEESAEPSSRTEDEAWLRARRRLARGALERLPDEQREVLELAYYAGLSQSELASRLGIPLGTIKSRTFAGLARLRELLVEAGLEPAPLRDDLGGERRGGSGEAILRPATRGGAVR